MLTLTENAQLAIRSLAESIDAPADAGVRIATTDGNDGAGPQLELAVVPAPAPGDQIVDEGGARVFLDSAASLMLDAETLDAQIDTAAQEVNFFVS